MDEIDVGTTIPCKMLTFDTCTSTALLSLVCCGGLGAKRKMFCRRIFCSCLAKSQRSISTYSHWMVVSRNNKILSACGTNIPKRGRLCIKLFRALPLDAHQRLSVKAWKIPFRFRPTFVKKPTVYSRFVGKTYHSELRRNLLKMDFNARARYIAALWKKKGYVKVPKTH